MKRLALRLAPALLAPLALLAAAPRAASAGGDPALEALLQKKAPSVVCVRYVLKIRMSHGGQAQDQETNREIRGAVVDPSGIVVVGHDAYEAGSVVAQLRMRLRRGGGDVSASAHDAKVLFGNDATEHEAVLLAKDSRLGLSFLQIVDPAAKPPASVDLAAASDVGIGQTLYAVTRKARGFDCAPVLSRILVTGKVEKPRPMWAAIADSSNVGLPVYDPAGALAGILVSQQGATGVEDDDAGSSEPFVLPLDVAAKSLEQAKKRAPEALAKAREAKEAAAKDAAGKDAEKPAPDAPKEPAPGGDAGMAGESPGMGEAPPSPGR